MQGKLSINLFRYRSVIAMTLSESNERSREDDKYPLKKG
ncbi:hypothetical protein LA76x_3346 [Lysobacter antibioticus]|uniref:Uncharacterized protein n=1 Tax=Lysobacter antibioticus TaxID=84531 RepID=A0A0S2FD64_LYSAN|nr:hypothetical protein LA76x_3346 [Lysobacter antibioticus]